MLLRLGRTLALAWLGLLALASLLGRVLAPGGDALQPHLARASAPELLSWWAVATQNTMGLVLAATLAAALFGVGLGAASAYGDGGLTGSGLRLVEFIGAVPGLILVGILRLADPSGGVLGVLLTLTLLRTLEVAQLVRGHVLAVLPSDFVEASRAFGASRRWQLRVHILPRVVQPLGVNLLLGAGTLVGLEAALSFTGLGLPSRVPSWGGGLAVLAKDGSAAALGGAAWTIGASAAAFYGLAVLLERRQRRAAAAAAPAPPGAPGAWRRGASALNGPDEASAGH
jgi:ABC-type dipeptide/oligopeptide/nickel transport system permease subunit